MPNPPPFQLIVKLRLNKRLISEKILARLACKSIKRVLFYPQIQIVSVPVLLSQKEFS